MDFRVLCLGFGLIQAIYGQFQPQPQPNFPQNNQQMPPMNPRFQQGGQPGFQQPGNGQSGFQQPGNGQSGFQQPGNGQSGFQQPGAGQQQPQPTGNGNMQPRQPNNGMPQPTNPSMQQPGPTQMSGNGQGMPQMSEEDRNQMTCAQAGRVAVAQCFQSNGGYDMMTVIALLSNGTQGQLPQNPDQVKQALCGSQRQIVSCIFNSIRKFNGSQQCQTLAAFVRLEQETVGLMNSVQQMCGTGLLPKVTECMRRINYDMLECYAEVGLNPELYTPQGSRMEGAVIGDNREVAKMFCSKRKELFECQRTVLDACPKAKQLQALSGHDQISMQNGMDVLCKDVDVYVSGLVCFQTPPAEVQTCATQLVTDMTQVTMKQIRDNLPPEGFFREYCKVRIGNLKCDSKAWENTCEKVAVGLKNEFQCNLLPSFCKNDTASMKLYNDACTEDSFQRTLRSEGKNGAGSTMMSSITSLLFPVLSLAMIVL